MRVQDLRKLSALGYTVREQLKTPGLETTRVQDQAGGELLLISPKLFGPTWPQVHQSLIQFGPVLKTLSALEKPKIIVSDSDEARQAIYCLSVDARKSRESEVFLEEVGFSRIRQNKTFDFRFLLLPSISVVAVIAIGLFFRSQQAPVENQAVQLIKPSCVVDLTEIEFQSWLAEATRLEGPVTAGDLIQLSRDAGDLEVRVDVVLGSAAKLSGIAVCLDGRNRLVSHRVDTSGSGTVLELPKGLDS